MNSQIGQNISQPTYGHTRRLVIPVPVWNTLKKMGYLLGSFIFLLTCWETASRLSGRALPGPADTFNVFWGLLSDPFYDRGPNDKGVALQLIASLQRVFMGFLLGAVVAVPLGIAMGAIPVCRKLLDPIVQILRPVSPLAWFPIGLAAFQAAGPATVFIIFITSLWPTVINTAFGVSSLPKDYRNVAAVFRFSKRKYLTKVLLPYALPHMLTGLRLSMGIAWMVIVAAEMLSGGVGIGFFVWDSWNALSVERVISAIAFIGLVGLGLDHVFQCLVRKFQEGR